MVAQLGLLLVFHLAAHPVLTLGLLAAASLALAFAARRLETAVHPQAAVLGVALLLRLLALPLPATLSDDTLRYLWDGKVARSGFNPYAHAPEAPELAPLRDEAWRRMPHRDVPTVYPPLAITAFSIATLLPFPLLGWKTLVAGADLAALGAQTAAMRLFATATFDRLAADRRGWHPGIPVTPASVGSGSLPPMPLLSVLGP